MENFINSIERDDNKVIIKINSNLRTCEPIFLFEFEFDDQECAELLKNHLMEIFYRWHEEIAKEPYYYLEPEQISELKSYLNNHWNAREHCWK